MTSRLVSISRRQRGFTLSELAIVMAVLASIIGALWYTTSNTRELQRQNVAVTELQTVINNYMNIAQGRDITGAPLPGVPAINATQAFLANKIIPNQYMNSQNNALADSPWQPGQFFVWLMSSRDLRLSFYHVSYGGCMALIQAATSCQTGQSACPIYLTVNAGFAYEYPTPLDNNHPNLFPPQNSWSTTMTTDGIANLCNQNTYDGSGNNSVEFDYQP